MQLRKAFSLDPTSAPACYQLGLVRAELGRHAEAEDFARRAVKLDPERRDYGMLLVRELIELDRHVEADRQLGIFLLAHPADAEAAALRTACRDAIHRQNA
jgi:tetratricopeptide (TPR) repeat protein